MTYHLNSPITRWLRFLENECGRTCSFQHVKDTTNSCTRPTYFKYTNFSTTYHRSAHFKDFHFKENTERYSSTQRIPFIRRKIEMGECSSPVTAVHASGASKWLISPFIPASAIFLGKTGKNAIDRAENTRSGKTSKQETRQSTQGSNSPFRKLIASKRACPYQIACAARFPKMLSLAAAASL